VCWRTRCSRCSAPRPRPPAWGGGSPCWSQTTRSPPSPRGAGRTRARAAPRRAAVVLGRGPRPRGGVRAIPGGSAWRRRFATPAAGWVAGRGARPPHTRARHAPPPSDAWQGRSTASPAAASPSGPRSVGRPRRGHAPASPCVPPPGRQAALAAAGAPGHGHGAPDLAWGRARDARGATARRCQAPTHHRPGVCTPARSRALRGRSQPASARAPDQPASARGRPTGANAPSRPLRGGRGGSSWR